MQDDADLCAQRFLVIVAHIDPIHHHPARRHIVKPRNQVHKGALTGASAPDDADDLSFLRAEIDVLQRRIASVRIGE